MIEPTLIALEVDALTRLAGLVSAITRRTPAFIPPGSGETVIDVYARPADRTGAILAGEQVSIELRLQVAARQANGQLAMDLASFVADYARYKLLTSGEDAYAHHESTTHSVEIRVDDGAPVIVVTNLLRLKWKHTADDPSVLGVVQQIDGSPLLADGAASFGAYSATETGRVIVIGKPGGYDLAGDVQALYINAKAGDTVQLLDADETVVDTEAASIGAGAHTFTGVAAGVYRVALNDGVATYTSRNSQTVVSMPT